MHSIDNQEGCSEQGPFEKIDQIEWASVVGRRVRRVDPLLTFLLPRSRGDFCTVHPKNAYFPSLRRIYPYYSSSSILTPPVLCGILDTLSKVSASS
jgi:hypothetical protein